MGRSLRRFAALAFALFSASACTGGPALEGAGGGGAAGDETAPKSCEDYSGTWTMMGGCPNMDCELTQAGCSIGITCGSELSVSGELFDDAAWVTGTLGEEELSCSLHIDATAFNLSCGNCYGHGRKQ